MNRGVRFYIQTIFEVINNSKLDYCIQNKYEMLPEENPSDIDMFYRNASEQDLDTIVVEICKKAQLIVTQKIATGCYQFAYILSLLDKEDFHVQLDFYRELSNTKFPHVFYPNSFLDRKRKYKSYFVPSLGDEINYQFIRRTMKNDMSKKHLMEIYQLYCKDQDSANEILEEYWGAEAACLLQNIVIDTDTELFNNNYSVFHDVLMRQSRRNSDLNAKWRQIKFSLFNTLPQRIFNPVGMSIALLSPDGGGKSTILQALTNSCSGVFSVKNKYFRPRLLKNVGHYNLIHPTEETGANPNPHGQKPNDKLKSFIRFMFYNFDFMLGYFLLIYPSKIQKNLVIFDRYYYDYYVDIYRYHYSFGKWVPHFFSFMIPDLDLMFVLDAPAKVLYTRKQELPLHELERQCTEYRKLAKKKNVKLIDVNRNIQDIVADITHLIISKKAKQTYKKLRIKDTEYSKLLHRNT